MGDRHITYAWRHARRRLEARRQMGRLSPRAARRVPQSQEPDAAEAAREVHGGHGLLGLRWRAAESPVRAECDSDGTRPGTSGPGKRGQEKRPQRRRRRAAVAESRNGVKRKRPRRPSPRRRSVPQPFRAEPPKVCSLSVEEALDFFQELQLDETQQLIASEGAQGDPRAARVPAPLRTRTT